MASPVTNPKENKGPAPSQDETPKLAQQAQIEKNDFVDKSGSAESSQLQSIRQLVAPLSKEQLIELIANACLRFPQVMSDSKKMVNASPASRRLMIRNIAFSSKDSAFRALFEQYGQIDDAAIVRSKDGSSRGYGFVTCHETASVTAILDAQLSLDGRLLLAKLAGDPFADFSTGGARGTKRSRRKLFVRNLCQSTSSETLRSIFEHHGELEECVVVTDSSGKSRGYGFVTFTSPEAAIQAVQEPQRIVDDRIVFVAFATPTRVRQSGRQEDTTHDNHSRRGSGEVPEASRYPMGMQVASPNSTYPFTPNYPMGAAPYYSRDPYTMQQLRLPLNSYGDYISSMQVIQAAQRHFASPNGGNYGY